MSARLCRPLCGLFTGMILLVTSCSSETSGGAPPAATPKTSTFRVGDTCTREGELRCGTDADGKKDGSALSCTNGVYEKAFACPGLQECTDVVTNTAVRCGTETAYIDYAKEGAPCGGDGAAACAFDRKTIHWCVGGTWVAAQHCPPSECTSLTFDGRKGTGCSNGGITAGDMCKSELAGGVTCSTDLKSLLGCQNGRAVVVEECKPPTECSVTETGARGCL